MTFQEGKTKTVAETSFKSGSEIVVINASFSFRIQRGTHPYTML